MEKSIILLLLFYICPKIAFDNDEDSEDNNDDSLASINELNLSSSSTKNCQFKIEMRKVSWIGSAIKTETQRTFYSKAKVGDVNIMLNDFVLVRPVDNGEQMYIGKVIYMWEDKAFKQKYFHIQWFCRGTETVLGNCSDAKELFLLNKCQDLFLGLIDSKANVTFVPPLQDWASQGGKPWKDITLDGDKGDGKSFYYKKRYDVIHARFEDIQEDPVCLKKETEHRFCVVCERRYAQLKMEIPIVDERSENRKEITCGVVHWRGDEYRVGSFVFLGPETFNFGKKQSPKIKVENIKDINEDIYPEQYRKTDGYKSENQHTSLPFCVGYIVGIVIKTKNRLVAASDICLRVNKMYRPEDTNKEPDHSRQADLNMLYWSDEQVIVNLCDVAGKCYVVFSENLVKTTTEEWTEGGPNRFYFSEAYDRKKQEFTEPSSIATRIGAPNKGDGKEKGKKKIRSYEPAVPWPNIGKPLRCLDVFAGCGGLSLGLHQSGIAETRWAIEKEDAAAKAFRHNYPKTAVFTEDCNLLLRMVMNGEKTTRNGQKLPCRGDVELLCGGPPCQGFSGMNRYNSRQYSSFKNSLVSSYLSYCDYYRPRFFIMENVRNFVMFRRSMVLKLVLACLLRMGYQCTFGILQAGNYGVPQSRRRAIILAAAPGEILPVFPEPTHAFRGKASSLSVGIGDKRFTSNCQWVNSAPRRTITVRDAMSDLPHIKNGSKEEEMAHTSYPLSHFQRLMRGRNNDNEKLTDHICKEMSPLVEARIAQVPTAPGSDWRDLPNIIVRLSDGTNTKLLKYNYHDKKNGTSSTGALRGVCACATGKICDVVEKQFNTLIPWCLPHTANRHNQWAGLYGRLEWDGFFSTTVTNPEPMGKQGKVLHPEQTRVVSVRECARSQGFPDSYKFYGNILDKHRQIGNAVPPPLAAAIGYEIRKCIAQ